MKNFIKILSAVLLILIILLLVILIFNPFNYRNRIIGSILNNYLSNNISTYDASKENSNISDSDVAQSVNADKNPLLNDSQEKMLEDFGVDVSQLPTEITPGMEACFTEKLGETRVKEIVAGATPSALEFFRAKDCIGQ